MSTDTPSSPLLGPAWRCLECGHESFVGYFASGTICPKCPHHPEMTRVWGSKDEYPAILRTYPEDVQICIEQIVEFAERAEAANQSALSGWYGSVCKWVREQEAACKPFTVTLPDPETGGDPLTVIEVRTTF